MSARKKTILILLSLFAALNPLISLAADSSAIHSSLAEEAIANQLGWVQSPENECGGYYLEDPFNFTSGPEQNGTIEITGGKGVISQRSTSVLESNVVATRKGEQITANKAFLYRDPTTFKLTTLVMIGDVHLRQPSTLIVAKRGQFSFQTKEKTLWDIVYRTTLNNRKIITPKMTQEELEKEHKITALTAWGSATKVAQNEPKVYELYTSSFSTCPPIGPTWQIKSSHIVLNKNTGRGYATHARVYIKNIPVFYFPYLNFSIDRQRKTGFLWPTIGTSNSWGPYLLTPFYWNIAPNYDMTITPGILSKRGFEVLDNYRYLTPINKGRVNFTLLPHDREFQEFQNSAKKNPQQFYSPNVNPAVTNAELARLEDSSITRRGFFWKDDSRFNDHWSTHIDVNYASDDYYLRDFGNNVNELTQNQLLQEGDVNFESQHWNFLGRVQSYQTLHPVDGPQVLNIYRRTPQLVLNGDYPDQLFGLEFFINNEATHFEMLKTPGLDEMPIGNRMNVQPGVSLPLYLGSFYFNPRLQMALTDYNLSQLDDTQIPNNNIRRALPIFDVLASTSLTRDISFFHYEFQQTLEPQLYYTYIPYRNQDEIPLFDTTLNTLVYDQIFNYNRFSGLDRIGDANQLSVGVTTRFIDQETGAEKVRLGVGEIVYFANRRVNLCMVGEPCPDNPADSWRLSPLTGVLNYTVNPKWSVNSNIIWNPISKQLDNSYVGLQYHPDAYRLINLGYSFARNGDIFNNTGVVNNSQNNLQLTDLSFAWPIMKNITGVGRWSEDWHTNHFQNLLFGIQYDTCCWATRLVGGKTFTNLFAKNNSPQYNSEIYIEFALKGLGNIGTGNPSKLLNTITGYNVPFGQEI